MKKKRKQKSPEIKLFFENFVKNYDQEMKRWKDAYEVSRAEYIADYEVLDTGFWATIWYGGFRKDPVAGEASWNKIYPKGFEDFKNKFSFNGDNFMDLINKINELVYEVNDLRALLNSRFE